MEARERQLVMILNVRGDVDGRRGEMRAVGKTGERRREDSQALCAQSVGDLAPDPAAAPGAVNQNIG